jgi:hypothetical protein
MCILIMTVEGVQFGCLQWESCLVGQTNLTIQALSLLPCRNVRGIDQTGSSKESRSELSSIASALNHLAALSSLAH